MKFRLTSCALLAAFFALSPLMGQTPGTNTDVACVDSTKDRVLLLSIGVTKSFEILQGVGFVIESSAENKGKYRDTVQCASFIYSRQSAEQIKALPIMASVNMFLGDTLPVPQDIERAILQTANRFQHRFIGLSESSTLYVGVFQRENPRNVFIAQFQWPDIDWENLTVKRTKYYFPHMKPVPEAPRE